MFPLSRNFLKFAAAGAFVLATATAPSNADERVQRLGPVGPHDTIMTTFGTKGVIAFYEPDGTHCGLYAVVYNVADESGASAAQIRVSLNARQVVNIDGADQKSLSLQCGDNAATLRIVDAHSGQSTTHKLHQGASFTPFSEQTKTFGWYDFTITVESDGSFQRQLAGHIQTGEDSVSDPAIGAGAQASVMEAQEFVA